MNLYARSAFLLPFMMPMVSMPSTAPSFGMVSFTFTPWLSI